MPDHFSIDPESKRQLNKFFKSAPKAFQRVSGGVLTRLAIDTRKNMMREIGRNTVIRNPNLLKNGIRFRAPRGIKNKNISQQETSAFSLSRDRHDGWAAINNGTRTRINIVTEEGRGGNFQNQAKAQAKFRTKHTQPKDVGLSDSMGEKDTILYLQRISASPSRRRKSWYLPVKFKNMEPGIYKFVGGSVRAISKGSKKKKLVGAKIKRLNKTEANLKPKAIHWQDKAEHRTMKNLKDVWVDNFEHEFKKIKMK